MRTLAFPIVLAALLPACGDENIDDEADDAVDEGETLGEDHAAQTEIEFSTETDDGIAAKSGAIMLAIDDAEVRIADYMLDYATDPSVLDYAETMLVEHGAHLTATADVLLSLGLSPVETDVSTEIALDAEAALRVLDATPDFDLDFEYMRTELVMHSTALIVVDALASYAPNAELQRFFTDTLPMIRAHRDQAAIILREL